MTDFNKCKPGATHIRREMEIKEFRVACGEFAGLSDMVRKEWEMPGNASIPSGIPWVANMFAARACGSSMEPRVRHRMWCFFHPDVVGARQDRIVLVEDQNKIGGDRYTLKKFHSGKIYSIDGTWKHSEIVLYPLNPAHAPIHLESDGQYRIRGWFVGAVSRIHRVKPFRYRYVAGE
jgi:hypothetical protein